jgi:aurora kinase
LAPELISDKPYDDKIDNWAVGVLTYELLTGVSPFSPVGSSDKNAIYRNISNLELRFNKTYDECVNPMAKEFITLILK